MCKVAYVVNFRGCHVRQNATTCRLSYDHISNLIYPKCISQDVPCKWEAVHVCIRLVVLTFTELLPNATDGIPVPWCDSVL